MRKCEGCGAVLQTEYCTEKGYINKAIYERAEKNRYCERCYKLIHYSSLPSVGFNDFNMKEYIKRIDSRALIINVVDIFDLEGSVFPEINNYFPNNPIMLIATKFDLFLKSVKSEKIQEYLKTFLKEKNIFVEKTFIVSSKKQSDINAILQEIKTTAKKQEVYFFGMTNVGKSTLINALAKEMGVNTKIAVSNIIGTTLDTIRIETEKLTFIDMPGIIALNQAYTYLKPKTQKMLTHKSFVRPKVYQLNPGQSLFIGGFAIITFLEGTASSFIIYMSNALKIHRTKAENARSYYDMHKDDLLVIPDSEERAKLGAFKGYQYSFYEEKVDITFSGLGFMTLSGNGRIKVECFENIRVGLRKAII